MKGYDKEAHQSLIKDYDGPSPSNGCALQNNDTRNNNDEILEVVINLFNSLSQTNPLPSNVASFIETFIQLFINNGSSEDHAMELQKHSKQEK